MTSNLKSEYVLDLEIQDNTKEAIRNFESDLNNLLKTTKDAIKSVDVTKGLDEAEKAANEMIAKFHELAKNQDIDFKAISKSYSKSSNKAVAELEQMYVGLKDKLNEVEKQHEENNRQIDCYKKMLEEAKTDANKVNEINKQLNALEKEQRLLKVDELRAQIHQNREIRKSLIAASQSVKYERENLKYRKLNELQAKREASTNTEEQKRLDKKIKQQKAYIKLIEIAEKTTKALTNQTSRLGKVWEFTIKQIGRIGKITQFAADTSGLISGVGRMANNGLNMVSQASDRAIERERNANRVKGMSTDEANQLLGDVYVKTGADYSTIVDAINRVRSVMGNLSKDELAQAAAIEVRYPGMSLAFASSNTTANMQNANIYANRMKEIQNKSGASDDQMQAATQMFANMRSENFNHAKITELQAVYLGLQNSGAFESQEELDRAFRSFARRQRRTGEDVFELAQKFGWTDAIHNRRNKLQAKNTLENMNWKDLGKAANTTIETAPEKTAAEKDAERIRSLEERKNQMMIKLIDIVEPIINSLSDALKGDKLEEISKGLVKFLTDVVPILADVIVKIAARLDKLLDSSKGFFERIDDFFGVDEDSWFSAKSTERRRKAIAGFFGFANGGITSMPSIVGERGPEAIIPLDFARSQRAANIATNITQTFNMGTSQTTALSLAQAVKSRDFTRAMSENAFITRRCGVF